MEARQAKNLSWLRELPPVFRSDEAAFVLHDSYRHPLKHLEYLAKIGVLCRLKKGIYCESGLDNSLIVSALLYHSSYVSFETALAHYGLIPETTPSIIAVTTSRPASFQTPLGFFTYRKQGVQLFSCGMDLVITRTKREQSIGLGLIACPEKALLDTIVHAKLRTSHLTPEDALFWCLESLRMEEEDLKSLSVDQIEMMAPLYRNRMPHLLLEALKNLKRK